MTVLACLSLSVGAYVSLAALGRAIEDGHVRVPRALRRAGRSLITRVQARSGGVPR